MNATGFIRRHRSRRITATAAIMTIAGLVALRSQSSVDWRVPPTHAQLLPESIDCWEPALAIGPGGQVYVVAGKRTGVLRSPGADQRQVVWRSDDGGATFKGPWPLTKEGYSHYDQRMAVDANGTVYISYMDHENATRRGAVSLAGPSVRALPTRSPRLWSRTPHAP
jgi:hypothetical protein